jgi:hypothetical protein
LALIPAIHVDIADHEHTAAWIAESLAPGHFALLISCGPGRCTTMFFGGGNDLRTDIWRATICHDYFFRAQVARLIFTRAPRVSPSG